MSVTTDVRKTVVEQGKQALDEARKPWYAAVGVSDLAYGRLQQQLTQLPTEVQDRLRRLRANAGEIDAAHVRDAVGTAAVQAKEVYAAYTDQVREQYETLAHRGELVVRRLRRNPEVHGAFDKAEALISDAGRKVEDAEDAVTKPGPQKTAPRPTRARKAPAKR